MLATIEHCEVSTQKSKEDVDRDTEHEENSSEKIPIYPGVSDYEHTGKFRILFAGDSGIGKTLLIKMFLSGPEIVSTDTPNSRFEKIEFTRASTQCTTNSLRRPDLKHGYSGCDDLPPDVAEGPSASGERSSIVENISHNITFIEFPGFGMYMDAMDTIKPIIELLQLQYRQTSKVFVPNAPRLERFLMTPNGAHTHIDVCLFGMLHRIKGVDLEFMKKLSKVVNVVPLILKSDTLTHIEIVDLKLSILRKLQSNNIEVYTFGNTMEEIIRRTEAGESGYIPFALSSATRTLPLLQTQPGYPGVVNEFEDFKEKLLLGYINDIRYSNALKFIRWCRDHSPAPVKASVYSDLKESVYPKSRMGDNDENERIDYSTIDSGLETSANCKCCRISNDLFSPQWDLICDESDRIHNTDSISNISLNRDSFSQGGKRLIPDLSSREAARCFHNEKQSYGSVCNTHGIQSPDKQLYCSQKLNSGVRTQRTEINNLMSKYSGSSQAGEYSITSNDASSMNVNQMSITDVPKMSSTRKHNKLVGKVFGRLRTIGGG